MRYLLIILLSCLFFVSPGQLPPRPEPPRLYNNLSKEFPGFLSQQEAGAIEQKLQNFSNETSNQIAVVIVDDLNGMDAGQFAYTLGTEWGVGNKGFNNGIVILIKPTGNAGGRDLFIATGYGLEGAIPDLMTKRVREQHIQPLLKEGRFYEAIDEGTTVLMQLAKGEYNQKDERRYAKKERMPMTAIIIIIIVILILRSFFGGGGGGRTFSRGGRHIWWAGLGGLGGGRGFGGGGGGGGFGGFGGGGFGGGGSGGKW